MTNPIDSVFVWGLNTGHFSQLRELVLSGGLAQLIESGGLVLQEDGRTIKLFEAALFKHHHTVIIDDTPETMRDCHDRAGCKFLPNRA
jgi:hypothetical protein